MLLQEKALEKKEVADRFAIAEDDDDLASAAELTFFQASKSLLLSRAADAFRQKLMKKKRETPAPWQTTGRRELLYKMKVHKSPLVDTSPATPTLAQNTALRHVMPRSALWAYLRRSKTTYAAS